MIWSFGGSSGFRVNDSTSKEFNQPGREPGGLLLTLFTVNLAQGEGWGAGKDAAAL